MLLSIPYLSSCLVFCFLCISCISCGYLLYQLNSNMPSVAPGKLELFAVGHKKNGLSSSSFVPTNLALDIALALTLRCIYSLKRATRPTASEASDDRTALVCR
ncbi:hypothetical protein C8F01DRAFT_1143382 [Mycena amicta]|nr:hypothetical protein C8F01DRAFT_1143382 [Mycena amicta]